MTTPLNQYATPLFEAVINYAREHKISFHTPGHKHGVSIPQEFRNFVGERIFDCDLTLLEEVDSLHDPRGVIKEAQKLAAAAYGSDYAFFLVNGSSGGNHAMILSVCDPGDKIIVPRNAHRSVLAGIILSGAIPVYVMPERNDEWNLMLNITPESVARALEENPGARAVLVTSPTYQGITANLREIARITHKAGAILLVDEAHGPHLKFHAELPPSAMTCGADMCVQSTHKIISSMTQASLLLVKHSVDILKLKRVLTLLMTTSPSYILMASLDLARMQMATRGRELLSVTMLLAEDARRRINQIPGLYCFGRECIGQPGAFGQDPTKLSVDVTGLGLTGYQVAQTLNHNHKIQVEFADIDTFLLIVSIGNTSKDINRLIAGLHAVAAEAPGNTRNRIRLRLPGGMPEVVMTPREAMFAPTVKIPLRDAVGEVSAEVFSPYPPGIPLLNPGERVSAGLIDYLKELQARGGRVQGQADAKLRTIKVVARPGLEEKKINKDVASNGEKRDNAPASGVEG
jgi:lysine decarboxylase